MRGCTLHSCKVHRSMYRAFSCHARMHTVSLKLPVKKNWRPRWPLDPARAAPEGHPPTTRTILPESRRLRVRNFSMDLPVPLSFIPRLYSLNSLSQVLFVRQLTTSRCRSPDYVTRPFFSFSPVSPTLVPFRFLSTIFPIKRPFTRKFAPFHVQFSPSCCRSRSFRQTDIRCNHRDYESSSSS